MTLTDCAGEELIALPVAIGVALELLLGVDEVVAFGEEADVESVFVGVGLAEAAAGVPAIIFSRGKDG